VRYGCIETVKEGLRGFIGDNKNGNIKKCLPSSFLRSDSDEMTGDAIENKTDSTEGKGA